MAKILVVEDEVHIQRLIKLILEKNGMEVELAESGERALQLLTEAGRQAPDLILLDIMMPGIDGMQVLQAVKNDSRLRDLPVILLTALAQANVVLQGIKLGARDYIRKPFHPADLVARVTKHLAPGTNPVSTPVAS